MASRISLVFLVLCAFTTFGCRHTYAGVKADTRHAVQKTGEGVEKTGKKIEGEGSKK